MTTIPDVPPGFKRCTKCGETFPATPEYFFRNKEGKYGLAAQCKPCRAEYSHQHNLANQERILERKRIYRERNREQTREYALNYYYSHREERLKYSHDYQNNHKDQRRESHRAYREANLELCRDRSRRRRAKKQELPVDWAAQDSIYAIDYFHGCCAICGRPLADLFGEHYLSMDHWIPLSDPRADNPGTVPGNLLPLCHGIDGCNNHKKNHDPIDWLKARYGSRKAATILKRIEEFFATVRKAPMPAPPDAQPGSR